MKQQRTCGLEGLPPRQREAYELHLEGLTAPDIAKRMGAGDSRAYDLIARAKKKLVPAKGAGEETREPRSVTRTEMIRLLGEKTYEILMSMDGDTIKQAKLRDKAIAYGVLLDKQRLLQGEPTEIMSVERRAKLDELVGIVTKEAARRGIRFAADGTVLPNESPDPETRH